MAGNKNIERWKRAMKPGGSGLLDELLHDDVVFTSPVVHTPQRGKAMTTAYLTAANVVLGTEDFHYVREFDCGSSAVLEFETVIDGITVNGVDMIEWDADGKITDFKVMVRPLKAIHTVHASMGAVLEEMWGKKGG